MAVANAESIESGVPPRRRRKKGRFIKQGYHKSEREDARRVAARAFLSGITLDCHAQHLHKSKEGSPLPSAIEQNHDNHEDVLMPSATNTSTPPSRRLHELVLDKGLQASPFKISPSKSLEHSLNSPSSIKRFDIGQSLAHVESMIGDKIWLSSVRHGPVAGGLGVDASGAFVHRVPSVLDAIGSNRLVFATTGGVPFAVSSVIPYDMYGGKLRQDFSHERKRVRTTSMSLQIDLEGIELGTSTEEVSLAFLLTPLWVTQEPGDLDTPPLVRRQSIRRSVGGEGVKRSSTPTPLSQYHLQSASVETLGVSFPWQLFRDNHSPSYIITHYHPLSLDNYEFFMGRNTTTVTPLGYRVSIIQYARPSDTKKGINEQFSEVFPHIKLSLSKLRSVKREMHRIATECDVDLAAVAYSYVYYEKLVLMGTVTKPIRKVVAGCCLLMAAKFFTDIRRPGIKSLIDRITDVFRVSVKDLLLYEFPVLVALQFSLLTPTHQVRVHFDRLREME